VRIDPIECREGRWKELEKRVENHIERAKYRQERQENFSKRLDNYNEILKGLEERDKEYIPRAIASREMWEPTDKWVNFCKQIFNLRDSLFELQNRLDKFTSAFKDATTGDLVIKGFMQVNHLTETLISQISRAGNTKRPLREAVF
jgi:hypothetical protein